MKCPYQTRVIHKPEYTKGYMKSAAEDITIFCECLQCECPYYYFKTGYSPSAHIEEHCKKAEREVKKQCN